MKKSNHAPTGTSALAELSLTGGLERCRSCGQRGDVGEKELSPGAEPPVDFDLRAVVARKSPACPQLSPAPFPEIAVIQPTDWNVGNELRHERIWRDARDRAREKKRQADC